MSPIPASNLIGALAAAISNETATYDQWRGIETAIANAKCEAASSAVADAEAALIEAAGREGAEAYIPGLALSHRRWLISCGAYSSENIEDRCQCQLVDAVLAGTPYAHMRWLWPLPDARRAA